MEIKTCQNERWVSVDSLIDWCNRMESMGHNEGIIKALKDELEGGDDKVFP